MLCLEGACLHFCEFLVVFLGVGRLVALFLEFVIGLLGEGCCLVAVLVTFVVAFLGVKCAWLHFCNILIASLRVRMAVLA